MERSHLAENVGKLCTRARKAQGFSTIFKRLIEVAQVSVTHPEIVVSRYNYAIKAQFSADLPSLLEQRDSLVATRSHHAQKTEVNGSRSLPVRILELRG